MLFKFYAGIDVSKLTLDVLVRETKSHKQFKNDLDGFGLFIKWLEKQTKEPLDSVLVCFEHTGLYSLPLAIFLEEKQINYSMLPALEIKRLPGITRGKNDRIDARRIADFAHRFRDKISCTKLPVKDIRKIHSLLTLRERLVTGMSGYTVTQNETGGTVQKEDFPELFSTCQTMINILKEEIRKVEKVINTIIQNNEQLKTSFELLITIKGIGFMVAAHLIVYTHNFTRFDNWRKFACYCGIAPFEHQSGTGIRGKTQVSSIANMQVKKLLHMAAVSAVCFDTELREYYMRRQKEGKAKMAVINIVRNKIVSRAFAVVKRGTPFVDIKKYAAGQTCNKETKHGLNLEID
jgi:transposase